MIYLGGVPSSGSSGNSVYLGNAIDLVESNNVTSNVAQDLLNKSLETASQMTTEEGKQRFLNSLGNAMQKAVNSGKITQSEMENIVKTVSSKLYQSTTSGGTGGGGGR